MGPEGSRTKPFILSQTNRGQAGRGMAGAGALQGGAAGRAHPGQAGFQVRGLSLGLSMAAGSRELVSQQTSRPAQVPVRALPLDLGMARKLAQEGWVSPRGRSLSPATL